MERVGQRHADPRQDLELVHLERRLPAARLRRRAGHADDVAEMEIELARALDRADQLDAAGAVDEVEEDELPHVAARHDPAGEAALRRVVGRAGLELLGLGADGRDLVPVRKPLGKVIAARVYAALTSMILNFLAPLGVGASTTSPFL